MADRKERWIVKEIAEHRVVLLLHELPDGRREVGYTSPRFWREDCGPCQGHHLAMELCRRDQCYVLLRIAGDRDSLGIEYHPTAEGVLHVPHRKERKELPNA